MKTIFIVDDSATNLMTAKEALGGSYKVLTISSAERMFKMLDKVIPDAILMDIGMPEMSGFEAIKLLKSDIRYRGIPILVVTGKNDAESELRGFELGAVDFVNKPFSFPVLKRRLEMQLDMDRLVKESLLEVRKIQEAVITVLAKTVENRDKITGGHIERTQFYLEVLIYAMLERWVYAEEILGWDMDILLPSAQLHDVGKISVSDLILNKPTELTDAEFQIIKGHSLEGERIIDEIIKVAGIKDEFFLFAKRFAGAHHERWDGFGYPRGLKGEEIPLESRILAICDVYDALVSERPYKKAFTHGDAVKIIEVEAGKQFDPKIVKVFLEVESEFLKGLADKFQGKG